MYNRPPDGKYIVVKVVMIALNFQTGAIEPVLIVTHPTYIYLRNGLIFDHAHETIADGFFDLVIDWRFAIESGDGTYIFTLTHQRIHARLVKRF